MMKLQMLKCALRSIAAIRESKVLTGRSLACLAREIEQGLTLAIYLGISDSTITGMGFDALANGQNLVDITYRILLLWKRRSHHYKNKQADLLADALNDMGRSDVAAVIMDHHRQNIELTPNCFVAGAWCSGFRVAWVHGWCRRVQPLGTEPSRVAALGETCCGFGRLCRISGQWKCHLLVTTQQERSHRYFVGDT